MDWRRLDAKVRSLKNESWHSDLNYEFFFNRVWLRHLGTELPLWSVQHQPNYESSVMFGASKLWDDAIAILLPVFEGCAVRSP
eukprot:3365625-Amphidinium_carterae.1